MEKDIIKRVNKMIEESDIWYTVPAYGTVFMRIKLPNGIVLSHSVSRDAKIGTPVLKDECVAKIKDRITECEEYYEAQLKYERENTKENNKDNTEINKKNILSYKLIRDIVYICEYFFK